MNVSSNIINIISQRADFWKLTDNYDSYIYALIYALKTGLLTPGFKLNDEQISALIKKFMLEYPTFYAEYEEAFSKRNWQR